MRGILPFSQSRYGRPSGRLIILMFLLTGCTKMCGVKHQNMSPEQVVEGYLNTAFNMSDLSQRADLLEYTTGRLHEAIASASDETIQTAYIKRKYTIQSYSVIERRDRTPRETEVTFRLNYLDLGVDQNAATNAAPAVTTENTVAVVREKGYWLIRDVVGAKTAIDFPVAADSKIEVKAGTISAPDPEDDAMHDEDGKTATGAEGSQGQGATTSSATPTPAAASALP